MLGSLDLPATNFLGGSVTPLTVLLKCYQVLNSILFSSTLLFTLSYYFAFSVLSIERLTYLSFVYYLNSTNPALIFDLISGRSLNLDQTSFGT